MLPPLMTFPQNIFIADNHQHACQVELSSTLQAFASLG